MKKFLLVSAAVVGVYTVTVLTAQRLQGFARWHEVPDPVA